MSLYTTSYFEESRELIKDKQIRKAIFPMIQLLESNPKADSLRLHRINKVKCDPNFWSARLNDDYRVIFLLTGEDKKLLYVDHHDDAYNWCEGKYYQKTNFGAEVIVDTRLETAVAEAHHQERIPDYPMESLLQKRGIRKKDLTRLVNSEIHAENLLAITDEDDYLEYVSIFPGEITEALLDLEVGKPIDQVINTLEDESYINGDVPEHKDTFRRFHMIQSLEELESLLNSDDFEAWTLFLHPEQKKLVEAHFNGPALIEGGPGTGKTIVGIHRAVYLSQNVFRHKDNKRILFCTFTTRLVKNIQEKLDLLLMESGKENTNIDVQSVDGYIWSQYKKIYPKTKRLTASTEIRSLIKELYNKYHPAGSLEFYQFEYAEVVEKQHITSLDQYRNCTRTGAELPLTCKQRERAWIFFELVLKEKKACHMVSYVDAAHAVDEALQQGRITNKYDSIIVDEAQDLEPVKLRVLGNSTLAKKDNLFILSDLNQRIYKLSSWKKESGINIVGRTQYLYVNYRTTKQINDYACTQFIKSSMVKDHILDYQSIYAGDPPVIESFRSQNDQLKYLVKTLSRLSELYPPEQICVICPDNNCCKELQTVLCYENIPSLALSGDQLPERSQGISICTAHGVKGLEFRAVLLYDYLNFGSYYAKTAKDSPLKENYIKLAECQKYVATTRARDELYITYVDEGDDTN